MQLTTAYSAQNRGTFRLEDTAFKMGDSSKDRQSGGETFMPYQQGDQIHFQPAYRSQAAAQQSPNALALWIHNLMNLDTRVFTALVPATLFSALLHSLSVALVLNLALAAALYFVWYVMSFFDFQRVFESAANGPRHNRHIHQQVPATF